MNSPRRREYRFSLRYRPDALAGLNTLAPAPRRTARQLIRDLQSDLYRSGTKQLAGQPEGRRRAVLGSRRLICAVDERTRTILIERIEPRATVYQSDLGLPEGPPPLR